jgi:hypothetical protein
MKSEADIEERKTGGPIHLVYPSRDNRRTMTTRAEVVAFKIVSRLAAIPGLCDRLDGAALDEARLVTAAELEKAFEIGGEAMAAKSAEIQNLSTFSIEQRNPKP